MLNERVVGENTVSSERNWAFFQSAILGGRPSGLLKNWNIRS